MEAHTKPERINKFKKCGSYTPRIKKKLSEMSDKKSSVKE
jgi:hypothetical protein